MLSDLSFRKKVILSQLVLFIAFFAALFPFVEKMSGDLVRDSLIESTSELKESLEEAATEKELIKLLNSQKEYSFYRMSLINNDGLVIYDTHLGRLLGDKFHPYFPNEHAEVQEAIKKGKGYLIAVSDTFGVKFAYVAERFSFQGKIYVLRTAVPFEQIQDLTDTFEIGVLIFTFVILLAFNALIWVVINRLTRPIREIVTAIRSHKGEETELPEISLSKATGSNDDFQRLATAFNTLSKRIGDQIESLKEEKEEKEAILESLGEGVIAVDAHQTILYINFIACKIIRLTRRSLLGELFPTKTEKGNQELLAICFDLLKRSQQTGSFLTHSYAYGQERKTYIDLIAAPKAHGTGAILVLQDKTTHYRALEMGKAFVANASHELRTPITIIKGYAETLQDMPKLSPELLSDITEKIERNCKRMENLVTSLLTLADIENLPASRFEPCDLVALLENCQHTLATVHKDAITTFDHTVDALEIGADAGLLELALTNLLENAAKYSEPPAKVHTALTLIDEEEAQIVITDQGRGIPPEDLEHIFERFYRVDKTHSRRLGGAGLGLSIVKTIITKHDGTIAAASTVGEGTTFTITLPIRHHSRL